MEIKIHQPAPVLPAVTITLSAEEAIILRSISGKISGNNDLNSPREFLSQLYGQLGKAGYKTDCNGYFTWEGRDFKLENGLRVIKRGIAY